MTSSDLDSTTTPGSGTASSHGKTILIGEHAVVYGAPALVLPVLDARVVATVSPVTAGVDEATGTVVGHTLESTVHTGPLDLAPAAVMPTVTAVTATLRHFGVTDRHFHVRVESEVPTARGMGSSAAVAAAVTAAVADALGESLDAETHHDLIQECERVAHGRPSGLDARGVVAAVPVWFEGGRIEPVALGARFTFVVADTGVPGHTRQAVAAVRERHDQDPVAVDAVIDRIGALARRARGTLEAGDAQGLGATMDAAHDLLSALDVSSADLDRLVDAARAADALGAKLTGGGRGGCVLALAADDDHADRIAAALRGAGAAATWTTTIGARA
ncbi:mevalonate kinase [Curtobacterium sp. VKM Ac-2861]|uniref:mevalonate kinase n=1 Tax=unclassified Curtobacterium TaxID=257496 RepID=UPI000F515211|nr:MULTISPECIES: mevalonate kinase [unclassified Curtobacterium]NQW91946.1 mevalonate kinase [Curtobacterium sp. VKM Ac-2861]RPE82538.1 mevalonate kinase [Curtobacterium sp. PhB137]